MADEKKLINQIYDLIVKEHPEIKEKKDVEFCLELVIDRYENGKFIGKSATLVIKKSVEHSLLSEIMDKLFKYYSNTMKLQ